MKKLRKNAGVTLVEVMIVAGLMVIIALGFAEMMSNSAKSQGQLMLKQAALEYKQRAVEMLNSTPAFLKTVSAPTNTTFECIQKATNCAAFATSAPGRTFNIYNSGGSVVVDGLSPQSGVSNNGSPCNAFPSPQCPMKLDLSWKAVCAQGPGVCTPSEVILEGKVLYNTGPGGQLVPFNSENYFFSVNKMMPYISPNALPSANPEDAPVPATQQVTPETIKNFCANLMKVAPSQRQTYVDTVKQQMQNQQMGAAAPMIDALAQTCAF